MLEDRVMGTVTKRSILWELLHSWWVALAFIPIIAPVSFFHIAAKGKKKQWYIFAFAYLALEALAIFMDDRTKESQARSFTTGWFSLIMILWFVGIGFAFYVRKEFLMRLDVLSKANAGVDANEQMREKIAAELLHRTPAPKSQSAPKTHGFAEGKKKKSSTSASVATQIDNPHAEDAGLDNTLTEATPVDNVQIDVNSCDESELAGLPGINIIQAKKAIRYRQENNGFASVEDFYSIVGLKPHFIVQIEGKIVCNRVEVKPAPTPTHNVGRQLDL